MTHRAPQEPTRSFGAPQALRDDADACSVSLGCAPCPDFAPCGALRAAAPVFDCDAFCSCADPTVCDMVCRHRPVDFVARVQEIDGFDLSNTPRAPSRPVAPLPAIVPLIGHRYTRATVLDEAIVAIPLYELFHRRTGIPLVSNRAELAARFCILENATVIASGVDRDAKLEAWWALPSRDLLMATLRDLAIALVTAPNYSLFTDVPRHDNLHAMKRIALSWAELMKAGVPAALHLNARTERDYARWAGFIRARPEVEVVAFEFGTGAGSANRINWHVGRLCQLADEVGRPLTLVVRGGVRVLRLLRTHFASVVLIETDAFMRTLKRRHAEVTEKGRLRWTKVRTPKGMPIDGLLAHNVAIVRAAHLSSDSAEPPRSPRPRPTRTRPAQNADGQAGQMSLMVDFDATI